MTATEEQVTIEIRELKEEELEQGNKLAVQESWSGGIGVWKTAFSVSPLGCFAAVSSNPSSPSPGVVIGTTCAIEFFSSHRHGAWIILVLVDREFRRRGIASRLVSRAVTFLRERGVTHIGLDASEAGRPVYEKLGFLPLCKLFLLERLSAPGNQIVAAPPPDGTKIIPMTGDHLNKVFDLDEREFGFRREQSFRALWPSMIGFVATGEDGELVGFVFSRMTSGGARTGPVIANSRGLAAALLATVVRSIPEGTVIKVWILESHPEASLVAQGLGFEQSTNVHTRMFLPEPGQRQIDGVQTGSNYWTIAGPDLG